MIIKVNDSGENLYKMLLGTGLAWLQPVRVYADNETEAVDLVADYLEEHGHNGLYSSYYDLVDCCDIDQTVDEYAEANNLICAGNHGIYLQVIGLEVSDNENSNI